MHKIFGCVREEGKTQARESDFQRTSNNEAHGPGEDAIAGLSRRHLAQHWHRNGLNVECKSNRANRRRECVCTTSVPCQHATSAIAAV